MYVLVCLHWFSVRLTFNSASDKAYLQTKWERVCGTCDNSLSLRSILPLLHSAAWIFPCDIMHACSWHRHIPVVDLTQFLVTATPDNASLQFEIGDEVMFASEHTANNELNYFESKIDLRLSPLPSRT